MGSRNQEADLQKQLASVLDGRTEVITPVGMIDILTTDEIIEIKTWGEWKSAIGQILSYGFYFPGHKKRIHLFCIPEKFGARSSNLLREIINITEALGIAVTLQMRDGKCSSAKTVYDEISTTKRSSGEDAIAQIDQIQLELTAMRAKLLSTIYAEAKVF